MNSTLPLPFNHLSGYSGYAHSGQQQQQPPQHQQQQHHLQQNQQQQEQQQRLQSMLGSSFMQDPSSSSSRHHLLQQQQHHHHNSQHHQQHSLDGSRLPSRAGTADGHNDMDYFTLNDGEGSGVNGESSNRLNSHLPRRDTEGRPWPASKAMRGIQYLTIPSRHQHPLTSWSIIRSNITHGSPRLLSTICQWLSIAFGSRTILLSITSRTIESQ